MDRKTVMNNHMQIYSNENRYKSRRRNRMIAIGHRELEMKGELDCSARWRRDKERARLFYEVQERDRLARSKRTRSFCRLAPNFQIEDNKNTYI